MENPVLIWVIFALVVAVLVMPFEYADAPLPAPLDQHTHAPTAAKARKDTHKWHFCMSPFWVNSTGGLLDFSHF